MKCISEDSLLEIGYFQKPHGVAGTLLLNFGEAYENTIENLTVLFVETEGLPVPWFPAEDGIRILSLKTALVDLDWIEDSRQAKRLVGKKVWVDKNNILPGVVTQDTDFRIGFSVSDLHLGFLGWVKEINDYSGNLVLTLQNGEKSLMIPYHADLVVEWDAHSKKMTFNLPDGITEL